MSPHRQPPGASMDMGSPRCFPVSSKRSACRRAIQWPNPSRSVVDGRGSAAEEGLIDRLAEGFVADGLALGVGGLCVLAGDVAQLVLAVGGGLEHDLGDLLGG